MVAALRGLREMLRALHLQVNPILVSQQIHTECTELLIWTIWYTLEHVSPFEIIGYLLELSGTTWDNLGQFGNISDHL